MAKRRKKRTLFALSGLPPDHDRIATKATGPGFWLPMAIVINAAILVAPILWVLVLRWSGVSLGADGSASTLLATIGGIMGAIFTAGGLVIALVSVYTQLAIESRIRQSFAALLPELDVRASKQIEAHLAFTRATDEGDWRRAQQLAREALEKWPTLRGVRSHLGERMAREVAGWFFQREIEHIQPTHILTSSPVVNYLAEGVMSPYGTGPVTSANVNAYVSRGDVPISQSVRWLSDAIEHKEDVQGELWAAMALVHGVEGQFQEMTEAIAKALQVAPSWRAYFQESRQLALLVNACRSPRTLEVRLGQLSKLLELPLPASKSEVLDSLRAVDMSSGTYYWNVYWVALKKTPLSTQSQTVPISILHIQLGGTSESRTGTAMWMLGWQGQEEITPSDRSQIPIERLVEQLDEKYNFICHQGMGLSGSF